MTENSAPTRRIVYLVPSLNHVCVRHRVDVFIPALQASGWRVEKWTVPDGLLRRARLFWKIRRADVVVIIRRLFRPAQLRLLRTCARKLVYDFDDAVMFRDSSRAPQASRSRAKRFARTVRLADRVIAGNDYLSALAKDAGGRAEVVPTCVDDVRLTPTSARRAGEKIVIGWIGSKSTLMYLNTLKTAFGELGQRYGDKIALKVVCNEFPAALGVEVIQKRWSLADEVEDLRSFDIGVSPLADDPWTRGKCGLKLLEYLAVGIPAVASPVGVNPLILRDGETGFLAAEPAEWVRALASLIDDAELRLRLGLRGRESLRGRYAVADWADRYVQLMESAATGERSKP